MQLQYRTVTTESGFFFLFFCRRCPGVWHQDIGSNKASDASINKIALIQNDSRDKTFPINSPVFNEMIKNKTYHKSYQDMFFVSIVRAVDGSFGDVLSLDWINMENILRQSSKTIWCFKWNDVLIYCGSMVEVKRSYCILEHAERVLGY